MQDECLKNPILRQLMITFAISIEKHKIKTLTAKKKNGITNLDDELQVAQKNLNILLSHSIMTEEI